MKSDVSLLGTGLLGAAMVRRLLATGLSVTVWNRTAGKTAPLAAAGASVAASPAEALAAAPVSLLMLADAAAIGEVLGTPEARRTLAGRTVVQMGTIGPDESRALADEVAAAGGDYLEAPVLGSIPQALSGTLAVLVGGGGRPLERARDPLSRLGGEPYLVGDVGKAAALKLALNQLIGSLTSAFALSLSYVRREGVDVELFLKVLRSSALHAPTFDKKLDRMLAGDYAGPTFPARHLLKDMELVARAATSAGVDPALAEAVAGIVRRTVAMGLGDADYSALAEAVARPVRG